jgi:acyl-CoA hydrolase
VQESRIRLSQLLNQTHANLRGDVHGGWIMKLADEAGALAAMRHSQCRVVTVAIDQMIFHEPIRIGDLVILEASLTYVGDTSMEVHVEVIAEDPLEGVQIHTNTAYLVYVALDKHGRPKSVPKLIAENELEERRMERGAERQAYRLRHRNKEEDEVLR